MERHKGSSEEATGDPKRSVIVEFYAPRPGNAIQGTLKARKAHRTDMDDVIRDRGDRDRA